VSRRPRILIEAEVQPGSEGGIEHVLVGLVGALGRLDDGDEEYVVVGPEHHSDWLAPYLGPNQRLTAHWRPRSRWESQKQLLGPARRPAGALWRRARRLAGGSPHPTSPTLQTSDGFYESLGGDVLHITYPLHVFGTRMRSVLSMYDLQHRHHPEFFSPAHLAWRETVYPAAFAQARATVADSSCVKDDIVQQYATPCEQVFVAHLGSVTETYGTVSDDELAAVRQKFRLPPTFMLYPALTYEHKNHLRLLEAIAELRRNDLEVHLVCTGQQKLFWPTIRRRVCELRLQDQVQFLGYVGSRELRALYHLAQFMIFPSLFEGAGLPLLEAFREGTPVGCSDISALREYGGAAAAFFDPHSVESIAQTVRSLSADAEQRERLRSAAARRIHLFSWDRTARVYRAVYRKVAGHRLSEEDEWLLRGSLAGDREEDR
jgi:glycosyltransferase involved in cell wall biosynthesis